MGCSAEKVNQPAVGALKSLRTFQRRRLACPVGPEQRRDGALMCGEVHAIEDADHFPVVGWNRAEVLDEAFDAQAGVAGRHPDILRHVVLGDGLDVVSRAGSLTLLAGWNRLGHSCVVYSMEKSGESEERTRDRVLAAVLESGPVSAAELGSLLGFTPAAVRRHLDGLERLGLIEVKPVKSARAGAGRPARRYVLSRSGQARLGNDYLDIANQALAELARLGGAAAIEAFAKRRFDDMEARYRPVVEAAGTSVEARAVALAEALSEDGFVASTANVGQGSPHMPAMLSVQLCQGHCPIRDLASEYPTFCDSETDVFARLLGVDVRRLSTLASGGHVCTTHIPVGRARKQEVSIHQQERP